VALSRPRRPARGVRRPAFALLLALAMGMASVVAFVIGTLAPFLIDDLGLSRASLGLLSTGMIAVAAVLSPGAGWLVDRLGGRPMLLLIFAVTAAGLTGMALAPTFAWLLAGAAVAGIAAAIGNPATNQLVSLHVPRGVQGTVIGVKQSGVQAATLLSGLLLPSLATALGWRPAMALAALPSALGLAATFLLVPAEPVTPGVPEPVAPIPAAGAADRPAAGAAPGVARLTVYGALMGFAVSAVGAYAVLYAVERLGLSAAAGGLAVALLGLAGIASRIAWAHRIDQGTPASGALVAMAVGGAAAVGLIWLAEPVGAWLLPAGAVAFGATATAWNAVGNLVLVRELPGSVAGRMAGIPQSGFYVGFAAGPACFGALVDATASYGAGWSLVMVALAMAGGLLTVWRPATAAQRPTGRPA
jgi:predicted MFS family arabinose efflux permease